MFSEDEYRLDFFVDEGFQRKKCEKCGKFFWTRSAERKTCGDPPCDPYTFIGSPIFKRNAKQTVDDRALNRLVLEKLRNELEILRQERPGPIRITEVGAGIGTMLK